MENWDKYWAHGFLTSCADAFSGNYEGSMRSVWREYFETLPGGACIVDICTGNGAIAAIAAQTSFAMDAHFEIHGVDSAKIQPERALSEHPEILEVIHFHAQTQAQMLPFDDNSIDAITGQYALEYTPIEQTVAELARVMRPGASGLFVVHHDDSVVLNTAREELRHSHFLFNQSELFHAARNIIQIVANARTPAQRQALANNPQAEHWRNQLNGAAGEITEKLRSSPHPELLTNALGMVREAYGAVEQGAASALALLEHGKQELLANEERLQDLAGAAHSEQRMQQLTQWFAQSGVRGAQFAPLKHDGARLVGWKLQIDKTR